MVHGRLYETTAGIIGFGRTGRAVAKRCLGFNMDVLVADPVADADTVARLGYRLVDLDELLREADFVSVHAPLNDETRHLIDARRLALMKPTAFLINTARGGLVDEAALIEALVEKRIAGAGLDVFEVEPLVGLAAVPARSSGADSTRCRGERRVASRDGRSLCGKHAGGAARRGPRAGLRAEPRGAGSASESPPRV